MRHIIPVVVGLTLMFSMPSAFGYLDPGSGSMLLQVVLGGLAAIGVAARLYWHRLKQMLGFGRKPQAEE